MPDRQTYSRQRKANRQCDREVDRSRQTARDSESYFFISKCRALYSAKDLATAPRRLYVYMQGTGGRDVIARHLAAFLQSYVMIFVYAVLNAYLEVIV